MNRLVLYALLLAAIGLTAVSGMVHGRLSGRWGRPPESLALAQRLKQFPDDVGNWKVRNSYDMPQEVVDILECVGYVDRRYVNQETGAAVAVAVMLGPAGPISVHTPEVCYSSREFNATSPREVAEIRDSADGRTDFWTMSFESTRVDKTLLRVYYAWSTDGCWEATEHPRFAYAGQPFLFKIQLAAELPAGSDLKQTTPVWISCRSLGPYSASTCSAQTAHAARSLRDPMPS
jgi:hypothetical protein